MFKKFDGLRLIYDAQTISYYTLCLKMI